VNVEAEVAVSLRARSRAFQRTMSTSIVSPSWISTTVA